MKRRGEEEGRERERKKIEREGEKKIPMEMQRRNFVELWWRRGRKYFHVAANEGETDTKEKGKRIANERR